MSFSIYYITQYKLFSVLLNLYKKVDGRVKTVDNAKLEVSDFLQSWKADKHFMDDITKKIQSAKVRVIDQAKEAKTRSMAAIETALRKLEAVKQEKSKKKNRRSLRRKRKFDSSEDMAMVETGEAGK